MGDLPETRKTRRAVVGFASQKHPTLQEPCEVQLRAKPLGLAYALAEVADAVAVAVIGARGHVKCPDLIL